MILFALAFAFSVHAADPCAEFNRPKTAAQLAQMCLKSVDKLSETGKKSSCRFEQYPQYPTAPVQLHNGKTANISVVPKDDLENLLYFIKTLGLPWQSRLLCSQRTHIAAYEFMQSKGIEVGKLMVEPQTTFGFGTLNVEYPDGRTRSWDNHVAPFVLVENNGKMEEWVLDLATFTCPVRRSVWEDFLKNRGKTYVTDRFALDPRDAGKTKIDGYAPPTEEDGIDRTIAHIRQVIEEKRGIR